jgi:hypothetical protein
MKTFASMFAVIVIALSLSSPAAADYVCQTWYDPGFLQDGNAGRLIATLSTGTHCSGIRTAYILCSTSPVGPGLDVCPGPTYQYDRQGLHLILESLRAAAAANQPVSRVAAACAGGGGGCTAFFTFSAP